MLSEHEQRELRNIEQMLSSDGRFSAFFARRHASARGLWSGPARLLAVGGAVIMVAAVLLGVGSAFTQGLGLALLGVGWLRLLRAPAPRRRRPHWPEPRRGR